jgi:hypothetical protein
MLPLKGKAIQLTNDGLKAAAKNAGVELAAFEAVMAVESGKHGFDKYGRPTILFEPHVFYRLLKAHKPDELTRAVDAGVAYPTWGQHPYPRDSYPHFAAACTIDKSLAIASTSIGLPQILGENHALAGYDTPEAMWLAAIDSEDAQVEMLANFLIATKLNLKLKAHDWAGFARGYNGPAYARNHYDSLLSHWYSVKKSDGAIEAPKGPVATMPEPGPVEVHLPSPQATPIPDAVPSRASQQPPAPEASTDLEAKIDAAIHEVIQAAIEERKAILPTQPVENPPAKPLIHVPSLEELIQQMSKVTK